MSLMKVASLRLQNAFLSYRFLHKIPYLNPRPQDLSHQKPFQSLKPRKTHFFRYLLRRNLETAPPKKIVIDQEEELNKKVAHTWGTNIGARIHLQTSIHRPLLLRFSDHQTGLGPTPQDAIPADAIALYGLPVRRPIPVLRRTPGDFSSWVAQNHRAKIGHWPSSISSAETSWYRETRARDLACWNAAGITHTIDLCFHLPRGGNRSLLAAFLCFWNTATNTYDFRFGQMSITLLDILAITGLPIDGEPYLHGQFDSVNFTSTMTQHGRSAHSGSYPRWLAYYSREHNATGGIAFLEYWLCKFIFCTSSCKPTGTWTLLATALYNGCNVGLGQPVLGALYRMLYQATMHPFETSMSGPFWVLDFWIQTYFPFFRRDDIPLLPPADQLLGQWFSREGRYSSPPYTECFSYLYLLDEMPYCDIILDRRFPPLLEYGFLPGDPRYSDRMRLVFRRAISCSDIRIAAEELSYELYAPNHFTRQFGLVQLVLFPLYDAWNYNTSWHRFGPPTGPVPAQSMLALVDLPDWAQVIDAVDRTEEGYEAWWEEVSVNCWTQRDDELFAAIFGELQNPYPADVEMLARFSEDATRFQPLPATQPARAPRPAQGGIVIREPPLEGSAPRSGSRTIRASPAVDQPGKQKAVIAEPEVEDSSSDDDNPQTVAAALARKRSRSDPGTDPWEEDEPIANRLVRRRSSGQTGEGSLVTGEGTSASQAQAPTDSSNLPPPASAVSVAQLASIPVQVIDDSSPELEEGIAPLDAPPEEPIAAQPLTQIVLNPFPDEAAQEPAPIAILHEPSAAESPNPVGETAIDVEVPVADPADPIGEDMVIQEPAPHVPEVGEGANAEPEPEAVPVIEPQEAHAAAAPLPEPPSRLERLVRVLEVAPPGVIDEAKDGLQRLLSPDILLPGASTRAQEYLMVLRRERTITGAEFTEIYKLLQNLPERINERTTSTAQARQAQAHYRGLAQQTETSRDFLGDRAILVRDLWITQNHLRTQIQELQAQLTAVTARLEHEEPLLEQPLAAFEAMSQNLAQAREAAR
ncbi:putative aminotransferase-like, plant mobile domain-containing protein [Rosa chinensis]|uniref:Putative aminotransferase-like, plant mobile domain-containing protein n=1 Tax=Rosa chinensis TaxID=74649 RepID=A0A2P6QLT6_ROSCH|nr:uncharacterized protein LOC112202211 [Rosa chinensis]PRQ35142.1 putative aminotransferase-like, plant mobile domain-containing protein [Rosa chinensis]